MKEMKINSKLTLTALVFCCLSGSSFAQINAEDQTIDEVLANYECSYSVTSCVLKPGGAKVTQISIPMPSKGNVGQVQFKIPCNSRDVLIQTAIAIPGQRGYKGPVEALTIKVDRFEPNGGQSIDWTSLSVKLKPGSYFEGLERLPKEGAALGSNDAGTIVCNQI